MKRFLLSVIILFPLILWAQNNPDGLSVVSFAQDYNDLTGARLDGNSDNSRPCALLKVQILTESEISFKNTYLFVNETQKYNNEYRLVMAAGAKAITIYHPLYPAISVKFADVSNGSIPILEAKMTYILTVSVPETKRDTIVVAETFDEKLAEARNMYNGYSSNSDAEYFRKAVVLYEAAMAHTDCPTSMLQTLQAEYDNVRFMRKYTYLYEKYSQLATEHEKTYGQAHDSVYHALKVSYKAAAKLSEKYPNAKSFRQLTDGALKKMSEHPLGKVDKTVVGVVKRNSAYGVVTLYKSALPLNAISIYACKTYKPTNKDVKKHIGTVSKDGTYNVTMPDGFDYIIIDGEKTAHSVSGPNTEINITI